MSDDSTTQGLLFPEIFHKPIVAQFDQREGSSDGGALLLKAADRHYDLVAGLSSCLRDDRQAGKVDHSLRELVAQRVFSIACGYPDANDSARLSEDPIHKLLLDRDPIEGRDLAATVVGNRKMRSPPQGGSVGGRPPRQSRGTRRGDVRRSQKHLGPFRSRIQAAGSPGSSTYSRHRCGSTAKAAGVDQERLRRLRAGKSQHQDESLSTC
jgi:Transposase DDE domain group 1